MTYRYDPRIDKLEKKLQTLETVLPGFNTIHELGPELPEECIALMANDFVSWWFAILYESAYSEWLEAQDLTHAYRLHKQQLQLLQWHCRAARWVLKSSWHLHGLEWLLRVYPDARIIMTHRSPLEVLPSYASLVTTLQATLYDQVDRVGVARELARVLGGWVDRAAIVRGTAERVEIAQGTFLDVHYADLVAEPMEIVEQIYGRFRLELTHKAKDRMHRFLIGNPQNKVGIHRYVFGEFGLDVDVERERFRSYCERYGIPSRMGPRAFPREEDRMSRHIPEPEELPAH